jgi:hypothetical protein
MTAALGAETWAIGGFPGRLSLWRARLLAVKRVKLHRSPISNLEGETGAFLFWNLGSMKNPRELRNPNCNSLRNVCLEILNCGCTLPQGWD